MSQKAIGARQVRNSTAKVFLNLVTRAPVRKPVATPVNALCTTLAKVKVNLYGQTHKDVPFDSLSQ